MLILVVSKRRDRRGVLSRCFTRVRAFFRLTKRRGSAIVVAETALPIITTTPPPVFRLPIAEKFATTLDFSPRDSIPVYSTFSQQDPDEETQVSSTVHGECQSLDFALDDSVSTCPTSPVSTVQPSFKSRLSTLLNRAPSLTPTPTSPIISAKNMSISYPLTRPSTQSLIQKPLYAFPALASNRNSIADALSVCVRPRSHGGRKSFSFSFRNSWFSEAATDDAEEDYYHSGRRSRSISLTLSTIAAAGTTTRRRVESIPLSVDSGFDSGFDPRCRLYSFSSTLTAGSAYSHVSIIDAVHSRQARLMLVNRIESMFDKNGRERPQGLGVDEIPPVPALPSVL